MQNRATVAHRLAWEWRLRFRAAPSLVGRLVLALAWQQALVPHHRDLPIRWLEHPQNVATHCPQNQVIRERENAIKKLWFL